jgi:hypothetical protein
VQTPFLLNFSFYSLKFNPPQERAVRRSDLPANNNNAVSQT